MQRELPENAVVSLSAGLYMALAGEKRLMEAFARLPDARKRALAAAARQAESEKELRALVESYLA